MGCKSLDKTLKCLVFNSVGSTITNLLKHPNIYMSQIYTKSRNEPTTTFNLVKVEIFCMKSRHFAVTQIKANSSFSSKFCPSETPSGITGVRHEPSTVQHLRA